MARTYRARGTATTVAKKWVDGPLRGPHWEPRSKIAGIIAHRFYNLPCVMKGRALLTVHTETYMRPAPQPKVPKFPLSPAVLKMLAGAKPKVQKRETHWRTVNVHTHEECLYHAFNWLIVQRWIDKILRDQGPAAVSSLDYHPYVMAGVRRKHGRRNPRHTKRSSIKSKRRQEHVEDAESIKTSDVYPQE